MSSGLPPIADMNEPCRYFAFVPISDICGAANWALLIPSPQHPSLSRTRRDRLHRPFHNVVTNAKPHIRADAGREPVMETGPDARAGYLLGQGIHVSPAARYAGRRRARQRDLGNIC